MPARTSAAADRSTPRYERRSRTARSRLLDALPALAATELNVGAAPVLMRLGVAWAATCLLTLAATPANLTVMEPGGHRFNDDWRLGSVVLVWYFGVTQRSRMQPP